MPVIKFLLVRNFQKKKKSFSWLEILVCTINLITSDYVLLILNQSAQLLESVVLLIEKGVALQSLFFFSFFFPPTLFWKILSNKCNFKIFFCHTL